MKQIARFNPENGQSLTMLSSSLDTGLKTYFYDSPSFFEGKTCSLPKVEKLAVKLRDGYGQWYILMMTPDLYRELKEQTRI